MRILNAMFLNSVGSVVSLANFPGILHRKFVGPTAAGPFWLDMTTDVADVLEIDVLKLKDYRGVIPNPSTLLATYAGIFVSKETFHQTMTFGSQFGILPKVVDVTTIIHVLDPAKALEYEIIEKADLPSHDALVVLAIGADAELITEMFSKNLGDIRKGEVAAYFAEEKEIRAESAAATEPATQSNGAEQLSLM